MYFSFRKKLEKSKKMFINIEKSHSLQSLGIKKFEDGLAPLWRLKM